MMLVTGRIYCLILFFELLPISYTFDTDEIEGTISATSDSFPEVQHSLINDDNENFKAIVHPTVIGFAVYHSKPATESVQGVRGLLYRYIPEKSLLEPVDLKSGENSIYVDEVIPSDVFFLCISYLNGILFTLDREFRKDKETSIETNYEYIPHPLYASYIAKRPKTREKTYVLQISIDSGVKFRSIANIQEFNWIGIRDRDVFIVKTSTEVKIIVINFYDEKSSFSDQDTFPDATDYMISASEILLIYQTTKLISYLKVYHSTDRRQFSFGFPTQLKYKSIVLFEYALGRYYIATVDEADETCLWATIDKDLHLGRRTCWPISMTKKSIKSEVLVSQRIRGIIYANDNSGHDKVTYISANSGHSWQSLHLSHSSTSTQQDLLAFNFEKYDPLSVPKNLGLIDIQTLESTTLRSYITLNGGLTWIYIPHSGYKAISLDHGAALISINQGSTKIAYSLDHGNTWLNRAVYTTSPSIIYVGKIPAEPLKALIVSRKSGKGFILKVLSFKHLFKSSCKANQYPTVLLPKFHDSCYMGKNAFYKYRDSKERCWEQLLPFTATLTDICACKPANLDCSFGYFPHENFCIPDKHSLKAEEPVNCNNLLPSQIIPSQYVKALGDSCDISKLHEMNKHTLPWEYCVLNDRANFILLLEDNLIRIVHIQHHGIFFKVPIIYSVPIHPLINLDTALTFNYAEKLIYAYYEGSIMGYSFNTSLSPTILYCTTAVVIKLAYEPVSRSLIYLTDDKKLRVVSRLTNFEDVIAEEVTSLSYNPHDRSISFSKENKEFCHGSLFSTHRCVNMSVKILQSLVDTTHSRAFFLTSSKILEIHTMDKSDPPFHKLSEIVNVTDFVIFGDNLYYLKDQSLFHRTLLPNAFDSSLYPETKFKGLYVHSESWAGLNDICQNKKCQFLCDPYSHYEAKCLCPSSTAVTNDLKFSCKSGELEYLKSLCRGFFCSDETCLPANARCDSVYDCVDKSDEAECTDESIISTRGCPNKFLPAIQPVTSTELPVASSGVDGQTVSSTQTEYSKYIWIGVSIAIAILFILLIILLIYFYPRIKKLSKSGPTPTETDPIY